MLTMHFLPLLSLSGAFALAALSPPADGSTTLSNLDVSTCSGDSYTVVSGDEGIWPYRMYRTSSATSPEFNVTRNGKPVTEGSVFLTMANSGMAGYAGVKQQGAIIMSSEGDLIWFGPTGDTSNFHKQKLYDRDVITYWIGEGAAASNGGAEHGYGAVRVLDNSYKTIYNVCPKLNLVFPPGQKPACIADVHESYITKRNTMLMTVYNISQADLSSVGGPAQGWLVNSLAVEVDISTSGILFLWNPRDHVALNSSHEPLGDSGYNTSNPYDWFHMNSIQDFEGGYIINSRHTWTSYFINSNGQIEWQLDGQTGGDFGRLPEGGNFSWQHQARLHPYGQNKSQILYTCFNDNNGQPSRTPNASVGVGLILELPPNKNLSPQLYTSLMDTSNQVSAYAEGSYTLLPSGNAFIGYGIAPVIKEFGPASRDGSDVRWSAQYAYNNYNNTASSYRAFKDRWAATPDTRLGLIVERDNGNDTLSHCAGGSNIRGYVSWNGATDVEMYTLYAGSKKTDLHNTGVQFARQGFETKFVIPEDSKYVQVVANTGRREIGTSAIAAM